MSSTTSSRPSTPSQPPKLSDYPNLTHAPHTTHPTRVEPLTIKVSDGPDGAVPAFLHLPIPSPTTSSSKTAAILLSGAGGGVTGPSSIYLSLAEKLASLHIPIPTLRLDYRYPARTKYCVRDVLAALNFLQSTHGLDRFVLVGWSFGGAPVFTAAAQDARVVGCATVASQTAETEGIRRVSPRPVLLMHGTGDRTLSPACSERLYAMYGGGGKGERVLKLFEGDDHALTRNAGEAEKMLGEFVMRCAGVREERADEEVLGERLVEDGERVELMRRGGDLRRGESVE
ncbi:alpha/beta-hydrolase [Westerdykella ornata]|uniref:Alpha/beta-hydrolase n=1 Tax=Westerdykella ornata TaxID=318751 RepID=A0A6A6JMA5_WESOR|nr:alpha/beta-hydrolase [Westerdykella ornata]KAF2277721.1 alpha/beta-hydrolase [Westerdykella ornata]